MKRRALHIRYHVPLIQSSNIDIRDRVTKGRPGPSSVDTVLRKFGGLSQVIGGNTNANNIVDWEPVSSEKTSVIYIDSLHIWIGSTCHKSDLTPMFSCT